jgi:hypothetical protein
VFYVYLLTSFGKMSGVTTIRYPFKGNKEEEGGRVGLAHPRKVWAF